MNWQDLGITVISLALISWLLIPVARTLRLPYVSLLVVAGYVVSEVLIAQGIDTGLRWHNFHLLVFYGILPILIYDMVFRLNVDALFGNLLSIFLLAVPFMLISVLLLASILYLGIDHTGFPFMAALIGAALLSINGIGTISAILQKIKLPIKLLSLLKGESLLNGVLALVLVSLALNVEMAGQLEHHTISFLEGFIRFVRLFTGGIFTGLLCGLIGWLLLRWLKHPLLAGIISLCMAYGSFFVAELIFHVSGVLSVLVAGLVFKAYVEKEDNPCKNWLDKQWKIQTRVAINLLFLLLGVSVYLPILLNQWIAILLAITGVLLSRAIIIFIGFWLAGKVIQSQAFSLYERFILFWGGTKGAVTIALVFALPETLSYSQTLQGMAYGVVLFNLLIQAPSMYFLLKLSGDKHHAAPSTSSS